MVSRVRELSISNIKFGENVTLVEFTDKKEFDDACITFDIDTILVERDNELGIRSMYAFVTDKLVFCYNLSKIAKKSSS